MRWRRHSATAARTGWSRILIKNRQMWDADGEPSRLLPGGHPHLHESREHAAAVARRPAPSLEAEAFFLLYGLASSTLLACASLPQCYVMKYGTEVLAYTKFLQVDPQRRIRETAQMVMDVMCPRGLEPGDRGVRATMKVRVMHAIVRHMIEHDPRLAPQSLGSGAARRSSASRSTRRTWPTR